MTRLSLLLLALLLACALLLVTSQHKARKLFIELQKEQTLAKQLEEEWSRLQLEQGTLATQGRIEKVAAKTLSMRLPAPAQVRTIRLDTVAAP